MEPTNKPESAVTETLSDGSRNRVDRLRVAGWSAFVSAAAQLVGLVAFGAFMAVGSPYETIADVSGVVLGLSLLPVAWGLHTLYRHQRPRRSTGTVALGGIGAALVAITALGLVINAQSLGPTADQLETGGTIGSGIIGLWLIGVAALELSVDAFGRRHALTGIVAGVGYTLLASGFLLVGPAHPITAIGGLVGIIAYVAWAVAVGRRLLSGINNGTTT